MAQVRYPPSLKKHVRRYNLHEKLTSIVRLLGKDAQSVVDWAQKEARRESDGSDIGKTIFYLIGHTAAIQLVQNNHARGRLTTKSEIRAKTGQSVEMPLLYQEAGLRHPQEARNLRHNIFHEAFLALILHYFPDVETSVPSTGAGLTPDLMVTHKDPDWTISVEYKGYRSITLLSESEILKAMRYQNAYGTAWLVTTTTKSAQYLYGTTLSSDELIEKGVERLRRIARRSVFTEEQKENRGIARKGIAHLQKQKDLKLQCKVIQIQDLLKSCSAGRPLKGLAITTGLEFVDLLKEAGFTKLADDVMRVMKMPARAIHSETVTSVRLIG